MKNKIFAFVLLLTVSTPVFISLQFIVEQKLIEHEAAEKMKTEILTALTIPVKQLVWVKKDKEILLNGRLFDIKSMEIKNNLATIVGHFDDKETKLAEKHKKNTDDNNNNPLSRLTLKFLFFPGINSHASIVFDPSWQFVLNHYYSFDSSLPESFAQSLLEPPQS